MMYCQDEFFIITDKEGFILGYNRVAAERLKYEDILLTGKSINIFFPDEHRATVNKIIEKMNTTSFELCTIPLMTRNGDLINSEVKFVKDIWNGKTAYILTVNEFKNEVKEINECSDRTCFDKAGYEINHFFEIYTDLLGIIDSKGNILKTNNYWNKTLGYDEQETNEKNILDFLHEDEKELFWITLINLTENNNSINKIIKFKRSDSFFSTIDASLFKHKEYIYFVGRDITEFREMEQRIKKSEKNFRDLFRKSPDAYLLLIDGKIFDCNEAAAIMLDGKRNEIIGLTPEALSPELQPDGTSSDVGAKYHIEKALKSGSDKFEWLHKKLNGNLFWVEVAVTTLEINERRALLASWRDITKRKNAEVLLIKSEKRFKDIFQKSPDAYLLIVDGIIIDCNESALNLFHASNEQLIDRTFPDISPEYQADGNRSDIISEFLLNKAIENEQTKFEWIYCKIDSSVFWSEIAITKIEIDNRIALLASIRDITERKKMLEEISSNLVFQKMLIDNITSGIIIVNAKTQIIEIVNQTAAKLIGLKPEKIIGQICHKIICPASEGSCPIKEMKKEIDNVDCNLIKNDGKRIPVLKSVKRIWIKGEEKFLETFIDISERKEMENKIKIAEEKFRRMVGNIRDVVYSVDIISQEFKYLSPAFERITGYPDEDINNMGGRRAFLKQVVINENIDEWDDVLNELEEQQLEKDFLYEYWLQCKDGTIRYIEDHWMPIYENGMLVSTDGVLRDITERKKAEEDLMNLNQELLSLNEELEASRSWVEENLFEKNKLVEELEKINAEKDKFFSIISHDLKSPFQGFVGLTEIMATGTEKFTISELNMYSKEMYKTASNLFRLLQNLLEWAQMQKDTVNFNPIEFNISELVDQNIEMLIKNIEFKEINIRKEMMEYLYAYGDERMINSVIRNLLSNAVKFTNKGGDITIEVKDKNEEFYEIEIKDNGIGMPENMTTRLFKLDEKVGRKGTEGEDSTGLGLILCKEFIEKNGGEIRVESKENIGTSFFFTIRKIIE